jgi:hypothetical protein
VILPRTQVGTVGVLIAAGALMLFIAAQFGKRVL